MHYRCASGTWLAAAFGLSVWQQPSPVRPATPCSSRRGDSLPPRAFSAASCVVAMATAAWPWVGVCAHACMPACVCVCVCCCCSYNTLDLNSSPHPRHSGQAHTTWAADLLLGQEALAVSTPLSHTHTHISQLTCDWLCVMSCTFTVAIFPPVHRHRRRILV